MRIALGGVSHETSTFATTPTTLRNFEQDKGLFRGDEIVARFQNANICAGGFLQQAPELDFEPVPLLWTFAFPSGLIVREDYETLKREFCERLRAEDARQRVDGVLLDLHGAMVIDGIEDGDGDFIAAVREVVGAQRPVVVTQDLHGNHTRRRVAAADAIVGFDTYPHVDMAERGREAAELIVRQIRGEIRPVMALRQIPLFWSAACQVTAHAPMNEALAMVHELERRTGILSITLATGFPWADVPEMGPSVIVVADRDKALAEQIAGELSDWIWQRRANWFRQPPTVREALEEGRRQGRYPIFLADQADNTGGGASGDSTEVLRTFVELDLQDALVLYIVDPEVADQAHAAGVGGRIAVQVGGKSSAIQGPPVPMDCEVVAVTNGQFAYDGPMYGGLTGNMGRSAWLRQGGVSVVVVHAREQPLDPAFARTLGIDCARMKYISVKSAVHFRSGFERLAGAIYNINAAAVHTHDFGQLPYRRCSTRFYPLHRSE